MPGPGFCQFDAGILDANDKLTPEAKKAFVQAVQDELGHGTAGAPKPFVKCGPDVKPVQGAENLQMSDEAKFPDFHKNTLGLYEKMAVALNVKGQFSILPICDPVALAVQLGASVPHLKFPGDFITYGIALPALAVKLGFPLPVKLAAKFPALLAQAQIPPSFKVPKFDFDLPADVDLAKFAFPYPKIPSMVMGLVAQMPSIFIKLLAFDFSGICGAVTQSGLFGSFDPAKSPVWVTNNKVLVRKTVEMVVVAIVASTVGSSAGGIVGNMGILFGHKAPPGPETTVPTEADQREQLSQAALTAAGTSWSADSAALLATPSDTSGATLPYTQFLLAQDVSPPPRPGVPLETYNAGKTAQATFNLHRNNKDTSSCVMLIRACMWRGGAQDPFFTKPFLAPGSIDRLLAAADKQGARIPFSSTNVPAMSKGDAVLVGDPKVLGKERSLVLTDSFGGGITGGVTGVEGGTPDVDNGNRPTSVSSTQWAFFISGGQLVAGSSDETAAPVIALFDAKRMAASA